MPGSTIGGSRSSEMFLHLPIFLELIAVVVVNLWRNLKQLCPDNAIVYILVSSELLNRTCFSPGPGFCVNISPVATV
jgi:hypothetical protein